MCAQKVIIRLDGGLGNQMFQYAFGRLVSIQSNRVLEFDCSLLNTPRVGVTERKYSLDYYALPNFSCCEDIFFILKFYKSWVGRCFSRLGISYKNFLYVKEDKITRSLGKVFNSSVSNIIVDGYWQDLRPLEVIREQLISDFSYTPSCSFNSHKLMKLCKDKTVISVHVRRGDYLSNFSAFLHHAICDVSYYEQAIQIVLNGCHEEPVVFFFSDDIEWVKDNLNFGLESYYVSGMDGVSLYDEFELMRQSAHNVIANSTFSLFSAWLNQRDNKIVIVPKKWFKSEFQNSKLNIPSGWLSL